jgi:hypothetical protein
MNVDVAGLKDSVYNFSVYCGALLLTLAALGLAVRLDTAIAEAPDATIPALSTRRNSGCGNWPASKPTGRIARTASIRSRAA